MPIIKQWEFNILVVGEGKDMKEAIRDAAQGFEIDVDQPEVYSPKLINEYEEDEDAKTNLR